MTDAALAAKANRIQAVVEEQTLQAHGMLPMFVRASDYQLPTAEDYAGAYHHRHLHGQTEADIGIAPMHVWRAWENTSTNTAFYLGAMAYQYRCTRDPHVLAICQRTLGALKYIHSLGVEQGERGYMCKPYGGVYSNQTAGDQVQCVVLGLAAYRPVAPREDLAAIDEILTDMAEFEIEWEYISPHGYFAYTRESLLESILGENWTNAQWSYAIIYAPLLYLAWQATGDAKFLREVERWYTACDTRKRFAVPTGKITTGGLGWRDLYLPALLMELDPAQHEVWRSLMLRRYRTLRTGVLDDGTSPLQWTYDSGTGEREVPGGIVGGGPARTGRSAILAMACVSAQRWFPDEEMAATARRILEELDLETFRFIMPVDEAQPLPPEWQVEARMLDHDSLSGWLWAYWEGRWRGHW
ncbi:MAG: hypothetical protein CL878_14390 [Dehalococcoidia bacterium]|nr:hypothetical protein [Dehalococcoidia bacterium]